MVIANEVIVMLDLDIDFINLHGIVDINVIFPAISYTNLVLISVSFLDY